MRPFFLTMSLLLQFSLLAVNPNIYISYEQFMTEERESYLEIYFGLGAAAFDYAPDAEGKVYGGMEITLQVLRPDSSFVTADRFRILNRDLADSSELAQTLIHQQRLLLAPGLYQLKIDLRDVHDSSHHIALAQELEITLRSDTAQASNILLLDSYRALAPGESSNLYSRSGYELFPAISQGTPYLRKDQSNLSFYLELYNLDQVLGEQADYVIKYYLYDKGKETVLNRFASFSRKKASPVSPVLASFNIEALPTGNYELRVEALNRDGEQVLEKSMFFYRVNAENIVDPTAISDVDLSNRFGQNLGNLDSIIRFIDYLYPISNEQELRVQKSLMVQGDEKQMKRYFIAFWEDKRPEAPFSAWNKYYREVRLVNQRFKSGLRPGYRSDRGRVWLTYGRPTQVERRDMEPNMPPYEIWQYNTIESVFALAQTNRIFIFGDFNPGTEEFQLVHSTAVGELQSRDWRQDLFFRAYGGSGGIDVNRDPNDREFGSRTNQNIIMGGTGADRINR